MVIKFYSNFVIRGEDKGRETFEWNCTDKITSSGI